MADIGASKNIDEQFVANKLEEISNHEALLIDGYSFNGKILYATPNFPVLYQFNWKEVVNSQIDEILPNTIQNFHKDLIEHALKYSNIKKE